MAKIKSLDELKKYVENIVKRESTSKNAEVKILVGMATCGLAAGAREVYDALAEEIKNQDLKNTMLVKSGCMGSCYAEPTVEVIIEGQDSVIFGNVTPETAKEIISSEIVNKEEAKGVLKGKKSEFLKKQKRIALKNCGIIDPENINDYLAESGYQGLGKVLSEYDAKKTIDELKASGLRGRGGGGFPTGLKWEATRKNDADQKYIICNADEGDPGAFMDRSILEGDPHSVLEAMAIGGYATGATKGIIYIRAEYPLAVERLENAIAQAKELGLLGENILESGFDFDIEIRYGAGAFVCGEETSLIRSVEGERGEPFNKPPFPSEKGLWGKPTTVNNVETYANIAQIYLNGAEWFASIGTEKSKGTKVFALAGKVKNVGLVEVPMGTTLREIIYEIGGGIVDDKGFKSVQTGGPSGGCIPVANSRYSN
jgi:NADH:ubiquinone oxidoreductase subunit F (NADH-binding)/(2Fe-2S) ferredoxin